MQSVKLLWHTIFATAGNDNRIGCSPDHFSPPWQKNGLGTRQGLQQSEGHPFNAP